MHYVNQEYVAARKVCFHIDHQTSNSSAMISFSKKPLGQLGLQTIGRLFSIAWGDSVLGSVEACTHDEQPNASSSATTRN